MATVAEGLRLITQAFGPPREIRPRTTLYKPSEEAYRLYVVRAGKVNVTNGKNRHGVMPGEPFGLEAITKVSYETLARTTRQQETVVSAMGRGTLQTLVSEHPEAGLALVEFVAGNHLPDTVAAPVIEPLDFSEIRILQSIANGLDHPSSAKKLGHTEGTLRQYATHIRSKLGVASTAEAVFTGYETGLIDGDETVRGKDLSLIDTLTMDQQLLLDLFTYKGGKFSDTSELAVTLHKTQGTIRNDFSDILTKLKASNRIQAGMMSLVVRDRKLLSPRKH